MVRVLFTLNCCLATFAFQAPAPVRPPAPAPKPAGQRPPAAAKPPAPKPAKVEKTEDQKRVEEVLQLLEAQMGEGIVQAKIRSFGKSTALTTEDMIRLKKAGATESTILLLMDPAGAPAPPPAPTAVAPAPPPEPKPAPAPPPAPPPSALPAASADLPKSFGLYYLSSGSWVSMPQTQCKLQRNKKRALLPNTLVRQKIHANLPGMSAMTRIPMERPKFLAYFPDRKVSTFNLLRLIPKSEAGLREVAQLSVLFSTEQYQDKIDVEISPAGPTNMYFLTPKENLLAGEYGIVEPPPTSNTDKVALFDVWDFGIGEAAAPPVTAKK